MVGYILYIDINGGDYIIAILRVYLIAIFYRFPLSLGYLLLKMSSFHSWEVFAKGSFQPYFEHISLPIGTLIPYNTMCYGS